MRTTLNESLQEIEAYESASYDTFVHNELVREIMDEFNIDLDE